MKIFDKVVWSNNEPNTSSLWLKDGRIYYYGGGWKQLIDFDTIAPPVDLSGYLKKTDADKLYLKNNDIVTPPNDIDYGPQIAGTEQIPVIDFTNYYPGRKYGVLIKANIDTYPYVTDEEYVDESYPFVWSITSDTIAGNESVRYLRCNINVTAANQNNYDYTTAFNLTTARYCHSKFELKGAVTNINIGTDSPLVRNEAQSTLAQIAITQVYNDPNINKCRVRSNIYVNDGRELNQDSHSLITEKGLHHILQDYVKSDGNTSSYSIAPIQIITSGGAASTTNGLIDYDWLSNSANTFGGIPVLTHDGDDNPIIRTSQIPLKGGHGISVSKDEESITVGVDYNNSNVAYIAHLDIGDSDIVKQVNQSQIPLTSDPFLVCIDYGVGTGRFIAGTGGSITITTADGTRVHYKINSDYSIVKDESHFDHSELFYDLGVINLSEISSSGIRNITIQDSIDILYFKKASNVAITIHTDDGDFEVNCPQVSVGPTQKVFNSPDIIAGNEDEWNYLKIVATIDSSKVSINIEAM